MAGEVQVNEIIADCVPLFREMVTGRYSITIGGSRGKGTSDQHSDVDFRLYYDQLIEEDVFKQLMKQFRIKMQNWKDVGMNIDGCWIRKISDIDDALKDWVNGLIKPVDLVWTIWGYHILTDIYNQQIIDDPYNVASYWKKLLSVYPSRLKAAIIKKHMQSLRYWRNDYHYANKVLRGDVIFLAGISARLVHDMTQVIFALNETYFTGDGNNMKYIDKFKIKPEGFNKRVSEALYPAASSLCSGEMVNVFEKQRQILTELIDDIEQLVGTITVE